MTVELARWSRGEGMQIRVSLETSARHRISVSLLVAVLGGRWVIERSMSFSVKEIGPLLGALTRAKQLVDAAEAGRQETLPL